MGYQFATDSFSLTDTDTGNALVLNGLKIHDGAGGPFTFSTAGEAMTIDVLGVDDPAGPMDGKAAVWIHMPFWDQLKTVGVDQIVFCGQGIGRLDIGNITMPESYWVLSGHGGLDMELGMATQIGHLDYTYNDSALAPDHLGLRGIHLAEGFTANPGDDPTDPSTWMPAGKFRIGDIVSGQPVTLDVLGREAGGQGRLLFNFPAQGSMRIENIAFGPNEFGPCAIDGIRIHRLTVQLPGD